MHTFFFLWIILKIKITKKFTKVGGYAPKYDIENNKKIISR